LVKLPPRETKTPRLTENFKEVPCSNWNRQRSAGYTLPSGATQAVRGQFRYLGTAGTCTSGSYNDRDDLVFGVQ
jgi:leucyl aminopeptidase